MRMKAALLISLAYRPRLLVMDEPFGGLDPLVREELTQAMIELTAQERWAVFISSHDIDEVERLADWVGFIDAGRMQLVEQTPSLLSRFRQVTVTTGEAAEPRASSASPAQILPSSPGPPHGWPSTWLGVERATRTVSFVDSAFVEDETARQVRQVVPNVVVVEAAPISLKQIFVALARSWRSTRSA
jgi:ABC-2 type transport system ATP-binding protein